MSTSIDIEAYLPRLKELYIKHGKIADECSIIGQRCCFLGILSYELGDPDDPVWRANKWRERLGEIEANSIMAGFDGCKFEPSQWDRVPFDLGVKAREHVLGRH